MSVSYEEKIRQLPGPILVLGASGFVGANLFRYLLRYRKDVYGTTSRLSAWRLEGLPVANIMAVDLLVDVNLKKLLSTVNPRVVFDLVGYGAYSFEKNVELIHRTNIIFKVKLIEELKKLLLVRYIHAGSSSEYGDNASGPTEETALTPNSHYAVSKGAISGLIYFQGKKMLFPCANLRLYSVYGPYEDAARLIPAVISNGLKGKYPPFVDPDISRDFIYVDDACEAFVSAALNLREENYGDSFNIGTEVKTTVADIAAAAKEMFAIESDPEFTMANREWDVREWYSNSAKAKEKLGWSARTPLREGLARTTEWYRGIPDTEQYHMSSKRFAADEVNSVSAVIACYKDNQAIPIMYQRLRDVFKKMSIDYEIIFVNDNSPDNSEEIIRDLSSRDRKVIGITHSRNFGSQAAFRSGMEIATKNSCVLLDGDLQDPPELIEQFVEKWKEGYEVVFGRRVKREAPFYMQLTYKLFYRIFDRFSYVAIPHDAGDFSLMDKKVVRSLLQFPERDLFVRGIRAFAGYRQTGVDYVRPERMFGVSTNNFIKNINWAKKGILSFSNTPLNMLSMFGIILFIVSILLGTAQIFAKLVFPESAPRGVTTTLLTITFFGSINLLAISIIGEYIAKIFEEVKRRPHFIRRHIIKDGEIRGTSEIGDMRDG
jgi:polyisoprenyl-phosphate glycosyltransferase